MLCLWLEQAAYEVVTAPDGEKALQLMREFRPGLVLLDIMMPVIDGWEVIRQAQRDADLCRIPILLTSALPAGVEISNGVMDWLRKPFTGSQLLTKVSQILGEVTEGR